MNRTMQQGARGCTPGGIILKCGVILGWTAMSTAGAPPDLARIRDQVHGGQINAAIEALQTELVENPANEPARMLLAEAYEKAGRLDEAINVWEDIKLLTTNEANLRLARRTISRLRRQQLDLSDIRKLDNEGPTHDPFKIDMPPIDWTGLEIVEDTNYLPPILPPPDAFDVPPFVYETQHFSVYSCNERLSRVIGERAEIYLDFMLERLFGGRSWAVRFPILVYRDVSDYQQHGGPVGSGGVTIGHETGRTQAIILFQLRPSFRRQPGSGGSRSNDIWKYGVESVLPHELTHAVINEFFGGQKTPQWLHEAVAGRFEQTRDHYGEAARLARMVVAGEYFRIRDLFEQVGYPERVGLFYEQSAAVVLYLFEAGPDAMYSFLVELRDGNGHDAACAAALGIPQENAIEEFERRWVEWMKVRYIKDLKTDSDGTIMATADVLRDRVFLPWANESDTIASITNWRSVDLSSIDGFRGVGRSKELWTVSGNTLRCNNTEALPSFLGIRMNERSPCAVQCDVRVLSTPTAGKPWFGFAQLDADGQDTRVQVRGMLRPGATHTISCIWSDDLAIYVDDVCMGRVPAFAVAGDARDVDFPLALMADAPVEVQNLRVAPIEKFSDKPIVVQADPNAPQQPQAQPGERSRRRRREP